MKKYLLRIVFILSISMLYQLSVMAETVWDVQQEIRLDKKPLDTAVSERGTYTFILTDDGTVHIYGSDSKPLGQIDVGRHVDGIACTRDESLLILKSKKNRTVTTIGFDFIRNINIEGSPYKGDPDAPVTIIIFTDYQCPYCSKLSKLADSVFKKNKKNVKLVIKNFPLPMHSYAAPAAAASLVAYKKGQFWEFHEELYKNMAQLNDEVIKEMAAARGLDPDEFLKEMRSAKILELINQDIMDGEDAGVQGTPTVFINGVKLKSRSIKGFQKLIDSELEKKQQ